MSKDKEFKLFIFFKSGNNLSVSIWGKDATDALKKYTYFEENESTNRFISSVLLNGTKKSAYLLVGKSVEFMSVEEIEEEK